MKKALLIITVIGGLVTACGPSEEERKQGQAEREAQINEKVNEILSAMEEVEKAAATPDSTAKADTTATDSI